MELKREGCNTWSQEALPHRHSPSVPTQSTSVTCFRFLYHKSSYRTPPGHNQQCLVVVHRQNMRISSVSCPSRDLAKIRADVDHGMYRQGDGREFDQRELGAHTEPV
jgi:hypothetical protein